MVKVCFREKRFAAASQALIAACDAIITEYDTMAQVRQYNPPPNPAKISDPRAADYIAKHGNQSWEVDALPPRVLGELITRAVQGFVDLPTLRDMQDKETAQRKWLLERLKAFK